MKIEIWSDVVCPFCYVGKRRLEAALAAFPHREDVEVVWRSFELAPNAPAETGEPLDAMLARKYGMGLAEARAANARVTAMAAEVGLEFRLERARSGNTFDAHRLLHLAAERGLGGAAKERLLRAYFTEGRAVGVRDELVALGIELGLAEGEVRAALEGDAHADAVRADQREARELGVQGVPFFVIDRRYAVSGAQPEAVFSEALARAWAERAPELQAVGADTDAACVDEACAVPQG
ncbi:MAG: DsbA family oxidoreductase [Trueperaceae bacterium]|nr:DsbA family oxidoreductase [Trueperaceae bacterium]